MTGLPGIEVVTIETPSLGDRSYLLASGGEAAVVDPQRDLDRVERLLDARGLTLTHVFETHVHNDYVSGGLELARRTGAAYVLSADDDVAFARVPVREGDRFAVGALTVRVIETPGHTPTHVSYVVEDVDGPVAVFTGGSMLYGTVGRTDLVGDEVTRALSKAQYRSVRRLAGELPGRVHVHPTHGFGSFCSARQSSGAMRSTIAEERRVNLALGAGGEDAFVERLLSGLTAYPRYYAHIAPVNRSGPAPADLSPPRAAGPAEVRRRVEAGEWVVDLRSRVAFARGHVPGTVNVEHGTSFATYLGWTLPWGTPVTLLGDTAAEVADAQRQLVRIGIDRPAAAAAGGLRIWGAGAELRSFRRAGFGELADTIGTPGVVVLDVRRDDEHAGSHIPGAVHVPLHELEARAGEVPPGEVWVHCASGYRAALAASLLDRAGRTVVAIDDDWAVAAKYDVLGVSCAA